MRARIRTIRNTVTIHIEVTAKIDATLQRLRGHDLAAIHALGVIPNKRRAETLVHADIKVEHDEDRGLQAVSEIERIGAEGETLVRVLGEQQHVLGVAVGGIGAGQHVALLRSRRHSRGWPSALHVKDYRRDLREIRQSQKLLHQRDAWAGCGGEGPRPVPGRTNDHTDRSQFVLGLQDGIFFLAIQVGAIGLAVFRERLGERG